MPIHSGDSMTSEQVKKGTEHKILKNCTLLNFLSFLKFHFYAKSSTLVKHWNSV